MSLTISIRPQFEEEHRVACPACGKDMNAGQYICKVCRRQPNDPMVLAADKAEFIPKRYNKKYAADSICGNCPMLEPCHERVRTGSWVYCEIPTTEDVIIMELAENENRMF